MINGIDRGLSVILPPSDWYFGYGVKQFMSKKKWLLVIPPILLCLLDQTVTLLGQSKAYWSGNYAVANEGSPLFLVLLRQHPLAFEAGILIWIVLFCLVIFWTPRLIAMTVSVALVIGHTYGASTWIFWNIRHGYWWTILLFVVSAACIVWTWEFYGSGRSLDKYGSR